MQRETHLIFAFLMFVMFSLILHFSPLQSVFAFIGALLPDIDIKPRSWHRKVGHNIWFLMIILYLGFIYRIFDRTSAIVLSIGFFSHLIADSLTHAGIMPLWPLKRPKFNGPITTGGLGEYLIVIILLFMIYWLGSLVDPLLALLIL